MSKRDKKQKRNREEKEEIGRRQNSAKKKASDDNQDKEGWKAKRRQRIWKMVADVWTVPNVANSVGMARVEPGG